MANVLSAAETFNVVYQAYQSINFTTFDYDSIKQSLIDYLKLYYPEQFNDFIESDEFIQQLELFSYVGEQYAYRSDLNANENLMPVAQRKDSVLRLAKLISYKPTRTINARGLVKLSSIQTTAAIYDSNGTNLANAKIIWNDPNNSNWKEQFLLVINQILEQEFGSVSAGDRLQVDDVLFEAYALNNIPLTNGVIPYTASFSNNNVPMELVPVTLTSDGPEELRPESNSAFSLLYGSDGLGDQSETTGFMMMTKQGSLRLLTSVFDGVTPNQQFAIPINNINETDVWVSNVDPDTLQILDTTPSSQIPSGEWQQVDIAYAQNIIFNTNPIRNKYEVETLANDQVKILFGDGEFANIPSGTFQFWVRSSLGTSTTIPQSAVVNQRGSFTYVDLSNQVQTLTFTCSLINTLANASASEDIEHIRQVAPSVYYTQDRMVNGQDYNTFMLQDPSILKLQSINRTFAGDSKYAPWHDPSDTYENVKMFGDDLALYIRFGTSGISATSINLNQGTATANAGQIMTTVATPLLSLLDMFVTQTYYGVTPINVRTQFNAGEYTLIFNAVLNAIVNQSGDPIYVYLHSNSDGTTTWNLTPPSGSEVTFGQSSGNSLITIQRVASVSSAYFNVSYTTAQVIAESDATQFWTVNDPTQTLNFDTLNALNDTVVILQANTNAARTNTLTQNYNFTGLQLAITQQGLPNAGLPNIHQIVTVPNQAAGSITVPDAVNLNYLLNQTITIDPVRYPVGTILTFQNPAVVNSTQYTGIITPDIVITGSNDVSTFQYTATNSVNPLETRIIDTIQVTGYGNNTSITITLNDYVYLVQADPTEGFTVAGNTVENIQAFLNQATLNVPLSEQIWFRYPGRYPLNFAWLHTAPDSNMIDPAATNIIDTYLITVGYYNEITQYLQGLTTTLPAPPTPLDLRTTYARLIDSRMLSDTIVLHSGKFKFLFGSAASPELRATFKVIPSANTRLTDNQIKTAIVTAVEKFFNINTWQFGETFYFTELSTAIHNALPVDISTVVLVPTLATDQFGDLFYVQAANDEILQPSIDVTNIQIVTSLDPTVLQQEPTA